MAHIIELLRALNDKINMPVLLYCIVQAGAIHIVFV